MKIQRACHNDLDGFKQSYFSVSSFVSCLAMFAIRAEHDDDNRLFFQIILVNMLLSATLINLNDGTMGKAQIKQKMYQFGKIHCKMLMSRITSKNISSQ